jgi:hypothetical protein
MKKGEVCGRISKDILTNKIEIDCKESVFIG